MIRPQHLLGDAEAALQERLGLGVASLVLVQQGKVVECLPHVGMIGPERVLANSEHPFDDLGRLGILARPIQSFDLCIQGGEIFLRVRDTRNHDPEQRPGYQRHHKAPRHFPTHHNPPDALLTNCATTGWRTARCQWPRPFAEAETVNFHTHNRINRETLAADCAAAKRACVLEATARRRCHRHRRRAAGLNRWREHHLPITVGVDCHDALGALGAGHVLDAEFLVALNHPEPYD
jgi:hypothetical protein